MQAVIAPSAPGLPKGDDTAMRTEVRKAEAARRLTKAEQMRRDPELAKDNAVKRARQKQRAAAQQQFAENRRDLDPLRADNLQTLRAWFGQGFLVMQMVENIPPGWLLLREERNGVAPAPEQLAAYEQMKVAAAAAGHPELVPPLMPWSATGILGYAPAQVLLKDVGFDLFVNFMGDKTTRVWAIEVPLARSLEIFVAGWVVPVGVIDPDWATGGEGPYLALNPDTDDGVSVPALAPVVEAAETERRQSYLDYMRVRMAQPGTYEADLPLPLPPPTPAEKGAGEMPPSVAAGNPGLEPIFEEEEWPGVVRLTYWAKEVLKLAILLSRDLAGIQGDANPITAPMPIILQNLLSHLAAAYSVNEDERITQLRVRVAAFLEDVEEDRPVADRAKNPNNTGAAFLYKLLSDRIDALVAAADFPDVPYPPPTVDEGSSTKPPDDWSPEAPDPVPPAGLSAAQVQVATVEKAARKRKPLPGAYHPIIEYTQSTPYRKGTKQLMLGAITDFKGAHALIVPTIKQRYDFFYIHTGSFGVTSPVGLFYSDNTNTVSNKKYTEKGDPYKMNTVFVPSSDQELAGSVSRTWAVPADSPQSLGLFGHHQMNHFYRHMCVDGTVMFSVNPDKAIQFFPSEFCCSNVWWWESKLNFLPSTLRFQTVGQGGFNVAKRLVRTTGEELPDHFLFLPPTRIAYDMSAGQREIAQTFAATKQNGIIYRIAYSKGPDDTFGIQSGLRELMLAGYCSSKRVGPLVFAAYIVPGDAGACYPPQVKMNPGDQDEQLADPIYRAERGLLGQPYEPGKAPGRPWFQEKRDWKDIAESSVPTFIGAQIDPFYQRTDWHQQDCKLGGWTKMVVVMESYAGDCSRIKLNTDFQKRTFIDRLFECFDKMGAAGILHCDMKPLNMVQRTWHQGKSKAKSPPWNACEIRAIDFDPYFVKLVPWLPAEVLALINATEYFAYAKCFSGHADLSSYAVPKLKALVTKVNDLYPTGIAAAFRALKPDYSSSRGPRQFEGTNNPRYEAGAPPYEIYNMFTDEWEAARAFRRWTEMYMEGRCYEYGSSSRRSPSRAGMLARLLSWVKDKDASKAQEAPDPYKPGNFPFDASVGGIWGGDTVLGHLGPVELGYEGGQESDEE